MLWARAVGRMRWGWMRGLLGCRTIQRVLSQPGLARSTGDQRLFSGTSESLSEAEYNRVSNATLDHLCEYFERLIDEHSLDGVDCEFSNGVLTLRLGSQGTYVINRQPANRQIWLSSPISGPKRYDYSQGRWLYSRDGVSLHGLLEAELSGLLGRRLSLVDRPP